MRSFSFLLLSRLVRQPWHLRVIARIHVQYNMHMYMYMQMLCRGHFLHLWDAQNLTIVALEFLAQESFKGKVVDECLHTSYSTVILYRHTLRHGYFPYTIAIETEIEIDIEIYLSLYFPSRRASEFEI